MAYLPSASYAAVPARPAKGQEPARRRGWLNNRPYYIARHQRFNPWPGIWHACLTAWHVASPAGHWILTLPSPRPARR